MAFLRLLAAFVAVACATPAAWADYFYCHAEDGYAESADGVTRYFSGVFYVSDNDFTARSSIGIAWGKHLAANYEQPQATNCLWEGTKADAVDEVNDMIAFARRVGHRVVNTGWKWAGRGLRSALHGASAPAWRQHMVFADNHGATTEPYIACGAVVTYFVKGTMPDDILRRANDKEWRAWAIGGGNKLHTKTFRTRPIKSTIPIKTASSFWREELELETDFNAYRNRQGNYASEGAWSGCQRRTAKADLRLAINKRIDEVIHEIWGRGGGGYSKIVREDEMVSSQFLAEE